MSQIYVNKRLVLHYKYRKTPHTLLYHIENFYPKTYYLFVETVHTVFKVFHCLHCLHFLHCLHCLHRLHCLHCSQCSHYLRLTLLKLLIMLSMLKQRTMLTHTLCMNTLFYFGCLVYQEFKKRAQDGLCEFYSFMV